MARRGKRERAQIKNRLRVQRTRIWSSAWGAGTSFVKLGRKKMLAYSRASLGRYWWRAEPNVERIP